MKFQEAFNNSGFENLRFKCHHAFYVETHKKTHIESIQKNVLDNLTSK